MKRGVAGGFAQLGHGKFAPLRRMSTGDWLIDYSPGTEMENGEPLQQFTAVGKVVGESIYQQRMGPTFAPFRRDVSYRKCKPADIGPLITKVSFIKDPEHWGFPFHRGHIEITQDDCELIARAMGVRIDE